MRKNENKITLIIILIGIFMLPISYSSEASIILNETVTFNGIEYNIIKMKENGDKKLIMRPLKVAEKPSQLLVTEPQKISKDLKKIIDNSSKEDLIPVIITLKTQPIRNVSEKVKKKYETSIEKLKSNVKQLYRQARLRAVSKALGIEKTNVPETWKKEDRFEDINSFLTSTEKQQIMTENTNYENIKKQMIQEIVTQTKSIIKPEQEKVKNRIIELGGIVTGEGQFFNVIFAKVPAGEIDKLVELPEVIRIESIKIYQPLLDTSAYSIHANIFWSNNYTGYPWDVAVVDTGIDSSHPAFSSIYVEGRDFVTDDCDGNDPDDNVGHGTHVAGIIASGDSTYKGIAYGAWLINVKAYTDNSCTGGNSGFTDTDIMKGVEWAIFNSTYKAEVVSASLGGQTNTDEDGLSKFFDAIVDDLGIVAVIAAGNSGNDCASPPCYGTVESPGIAYNAITVGAMDDVNTADRSDDIIADYSSRGPVPGTSRIKPDIMAPGSNIKSANYDWEGLLGLNPDFVDKSGTSMATPHISGAAALLMSAGVYDPREIKALLINTAEDYGTPGGDYDYGWGYVDLNHAYFHTPDVRLGEVNTSQDYIFYKGFVYVGDKATLVWNKHAIYNGATYPTTYFNLSDLDLYLYRESDEVLLDSSTSADENVEQVVSQANATVVLKVEVFSFTNGITSETFALATEEGFNLAAPPSLSAVIIAPPKVAPGNNFNILVDVYNNGGVTAHNVTVSLSLPSGFSIVAGANPQNVGSIPAGSATTAIWTLTTSAPEGNYAISASAISNSYSEIYSTNNNGTLSVDATSPSIFIHLPENTTYTSHNISLNVSANENISAWWYSLNGGPNITFMPNTTIISAEGLNHLVVYANDTAGNIGVAERYFSVDTLPPEILIHAPINSTTNSDRFNFTFSEFAAWAAYSVDGRENITITDVYNWSGLLFNLTDGPHNITVYANDSHGNMNSTTIFWIRDTVHPTITMYSPENATYAYNKISLNVSASESIHTWWYSLNGTNVTFIPNTSITASEGFNKLVVYANDSAGNVGYVVQYFTVDTVLPMIRIISPRNKSYSIGEIDYNLTSEEALNWSVVSIDGGTNITLGKLNDTYFYNLSNQHQNLTEGAHNATFYVQDLAGNFNFSVVYFTIDVTSPTISFISPTPINNSISTTPSITINVSHSELHPDTLIVSWNGTNTSKSYIGNYTNITLLNLEDGHYSYYVWINDTAGNVNITEVRVVTIDTSPPSITNITPVNGSGVKGIVTISAIAYDAGTGVASVIANISNATHWLMLTLSYNGSGVWYNDTWNTSALDEGEYHIAINATDYAGWSNVTEHVVIVDRTPPNSLISSPLPNEKISSTVYTINGTAMDNESNVAKVWISTDGGSTWSLANDTVNWSYVWHIPNDGEYNITSKAEDKAGNNQTTLQYVYVTVDATPPKIVLLSPTPGNKDTLSADTKSITINISVSETHLATLILNWNGVNESLNYTSDYMNISKNVSSGNSYTFYVWANDTFGNANATLKITFFVASPQSSGAGGGGGGGGGGGKSSANKAEIEKILPGESGEALFDKIPELEKIVIHANKNNDVPLYFVKVTVDVYDKNPVPFYPEPEEPTYKYFKIKSNVPTLEMEKAEIIFYVEREWLEEINASINTVTLRRLEDKEWKELETTFLGEEERDGAEHFKYSAVTPHFSYFAITAEENTGFTPPSELEKKTFKGPVGLDLSKLSFMFENKSTVKGKEKENKIEILNGSVSENSTEINATANPHSGKNICGPTLVSFLSLVPIVVRKMLKHR